MDLASSRNRVHRATTCRDHARNVLRLDQLIPIINQDNVPSRRVAEKSWLTFERTATYHDRQQRIYAGPTA